MSSTSAPEPTTPAKPTLFVWTMRRTTHHAFATQGLAVLRWDLLFEQPNLSELLVHRRMATIAVSIEEITKTETIFQTLADFCPRFRLDTPCRRRSRRVKGADFGPYWVLLPDTGGDMQFQFHNWIRAHKRSLALSLTENQRLAFFDTYLVFNEEVDREIARSSEDGTCPVREWNRSAHERTTWGR